MKRMFICGALQLVFVSVYGTWAAIRPDDAFGWLGPFVAVVWMLVLYNNWPAIRAGIRHVRRRS